MRLYHLDFRALWWDEGLSLFFARLDYATNARFAVLLADTNPPIYRLLLGTWIGLVGSSAWAARLFSVLPGVVLVAVVYRLARELRLKVEVAGMAAALCAASPMLIYYSQEAKGYSLVALAGVASVLVWLRLHRILPSAQGWSERWELWAVWAGCVALAVGSHYIAAFLILTENLWTLVFTARHWRGNERRWLTHWGWMLGAQAVAALTVLPFVLLTFGGTSAAVRGETGQFENLNTAALLARLALELTQGPTADGVGAWIIAGVVGLLGIIGIWSVTGRPRWLLATWVAVPIGLGVALNAYHEFFFPRFVLYAVPALMCFVASGITAIADRLSQLNVRRVTQYALVAGVGVIWLPTLVTHYNTPTATGEDWRPVAEAVKPLMRPDDAAIYVWGWIPGYLEAYLPPAQQPDYTLGYFTPQSLDGDMQSITKGRERVWLFDYQIDQFDVRNMAGTWLRPHGALIYDAWPGEGFGHVALFALTPTPTTAHGLIEATFANGLRVQTNHLQAELRPGDGLALSLTWMATQPLTERYTIFLHGLAEDGSLAFGRDSEPENGLTPVPEWKAGQPYT